MPGPELNATITDRIDFGSDLSIFHVVPNGWSLPDFKAGQYAVLALPGGYPRGGYSFADTEHPDPNKFIQRAYSIASPPHNKEFLEFYVTIVRDGALTPRLWCLRMGDRLYLSPRIIGKFTLDPTPEEKNLIFFATGTGIAPFMSMLKQHLRQGQKRRFALLHGVRQSQDLAYRSQLITMAAMFPNFSYHPVISRERLDPVPWKGPVGHVQDVWKLGTVEKAWGVQPTPEDTHVYLCGHPKMITETSKVLNEQGYVSDQIHTEKYW